MIPGRFSHALEFFPQLVRDHLPGYKSLMQHQMPLTRGWALTDPAYNIWWLPGYLIGIWLLMKLMERKEKPFNVYYIALLHNINQTVLSAYMTVEIIRQVYLNGFGFANNALDTSNPHHLGMANIIWLHTASKLVEFIDTIIMCLKKNFRQVTFLHLYHHTSVFCVWWVMIFFACGGEAYLAALLNSFVHVVMYGYYLWATFARKLEGDEKPSFLHPAFYRPYITRLQIAQFVILFSVSSYDLFYLHFYKKALVFSPGAVFMQWGYTFSLLILFAQFYISAYLKPKKPAKVAEANGQINGNGNHKKVQ
jgi:hypothetical protein